MGKTVTQSITYTSRDATGATTTTTFDDVIKIELSQSIGETSNTVTVELQNALNRLATGFSRPLGTYVDDSGDLIFQEGDVVKVYLKEQLDATAIDTDSDDDLFMTAQIAEPSVMGGADGTIIKLENKDRTQVIFNRLFTRTFQESDGIGADDAVIEVVRGTTDNVESDALSFDESGNLVSNGIYSVDARLVSNGGFVEDERIDGSAFPSINLTKNAKAGYVWIDDLSTTEYTNDFTGTDDADSPTQDRRMIYYADEKNRFHWYYPRDGTTTTLDGALNDSDTTITVVSTSNFPSTGVIYIDSERITYTGTTTTTFTGCSRGTGNTEASSHTSGTSVRNNLQVIEGDNSNGVEVLDKNLSKKVFDIINHVIFQCGLDLLGDGMLFNYFNRDTDSKELIETYKPMEEISRDLITNEIRAGNLIKDNTQSDFTWQGNFYRADTYGFTTTWGADTTGFTDDDYNQSLRTECKRIGTSQAQRITQRSSTLRWKGTIQTTFYKFVAGELIEFTSRAAGLNKVSLRITKVRYSWTKKGCFVTINVEEDEPRLGGTT